MKAKEKAEMMKSQRTTMIDQPATERNDEKGITVLECAVILVLVALAIASFNAGFSATLSSLFTRVITALG
jgi:Flp pilus assembly pilin Flp